jgi:hypothetical protein
VRRKKCALSTPDRSSRSRRGATFQIGIGGRIAPPPLPHHRTYGSVYGGSSGYAICRVLGFSPPPERFGPLLLVRRSFTPPGKPEGQSFLVFLPLFTHEIRALLTAPLVQAFDHRSRIGLSVDSTFRLRSASLALPTSWPTMPSADFCPALRSPFGSLSRIAATQDRSPGVIPAAFRAQSPDLRFPFLMNMDFAMQRLLVPRWRLISGSCSSTRVFAPRFFQTLRHRNALALR